MNTKLKDILVAFTLSSLSFIHMINLIKGNIFELEIGISEKSSLIAGFLLLGIILFAVFRIVRRITSGKWTSIIYSSISIFFFFLFFNNQRLAFTALPIGQYIQGYQFTAFFMIILISIIFIVKAVTHKTFYQSFDSILLIISPIIIITFFNLITLPLASGENSLQTTQADQKDEEQPPIFMLLFDMFSRFRFEEELVKGNLPNFQKFYNESIYFKDVYSPSSHTFLSVPSMVYGQLLTHMDRKNFKELRYKTLDDDSWKSSRTTKEILFHDLKKKGYSTNIFAAIFLPYIKWWRAYINKGAYFTLSPPIKTVGDFLRYPLSVWYNEFCPRRIRNRIMPRKLWWMRRMEKAIFECVSDHSIKNMFLYAHFPIPHHAFIFDRYGLRKEPLTDPVQGYRGNLYYTDTFLGKFLQKLKNENLYEKSLIIIFSDHGWLHDPKFFEKADKPYYKAQIPFMTKFPYQKNNMTVSSGYSTLDMRNFLKFFINNKDKSATNNFGYFSKWYDRSKPIKFMQEGKLISGPSNVTGSLVIVE